MKITVTGIPRTITSFFFDPKAILSDTNTCTYLERIEPFLFGKSTFEAAKKLEIDPFDLFFVGERAYSECYAKYRKKYSGSGLEIIKTALILRKLYYGEYIRVSSIGWTEHLCVTDPFTVSLSVIDASVDNTKLNRRISRKAAKHEKKNLPLNNRASHILETLRLAAVKYSMQKALDNKEFIDKYNFRRFSTNLRLNNRPANLKDINNILARRKRYTYIDLSETMTRLNFSALYAMTYGGFSLEDIYGANTPFQENTQETDEKLAKLSSNFIDIIYNNNGIEISGVLISMMKRFTKINLPKLNITNLTDLIENYSVYYAAASLANFCESIFTVNPDMKQYLKKNLLDCYWAITKHIMKMKRYGDVVTLCHRLAELNVNAYRNIPAYQTEIICAFESARSVEREINSDD